MGDDSQSSSDNTPLDYADTSYDSPLLILCRMRLEEAELARAKLESEGIECFVRDANSAVTNPLVVSEVPVMVKKADVEKAREILARPAADVADGEYVEESWRCPKCHRKTVDLLPPSLGRRQLRGVWAALLILPIILAIFTPLIDRVGETLGVWVYPVWLMIVLVLGVAVFVGKRPKRCRECGHVWMDEKSESSP